MPAVDLKYSAGRSTCPDFTAAVGFWNTMKRSLNAMQIDLKPERRTRWAADLAGEEIHVRTKTR
jgi:hypothetical protein